MSLRTATQIEEEYTAVRTAYLKALKAQSYTIGSSGGQRQIERPNVNTLLKQMKELEAEYTQVTGYGIVVKGATPVS